MHTEKLFKMYVLVRKDLEETYRCVQGAHALSEYSIRGNRELYRRWNNGTLIFLGVNNEISLKLWIERLLRKEKEWVGFKEPDLQNQLTAIACVDTGEIFKNLRLA